MKNNNIVIEDWAGNILFNGPFNSPKVVKIMRKNNAPNEDIFVSWEDEERNEKENVYESIDW